MSQAYKSPSAVHESREHLEDAGIRFTLLHLTGNVPPAPLQHYDKLVASDSSEGFHILLPVTSSFQYRSATARWSHLETQEACFVCLGLIKVAYITVLENAFRVGQLSRCVAADKAPYRDLWGYPSDLLALLQSTGGLHHLLLQQPFWVWECQHAQSFDHSSDLNSLE